MNWKTKRFCGNCFELLGIACATITINDLAHNSYLFQEMRGSDFAVYVLKTFEITSGPIYYSLGSAIKESALIQRIKEELDKTRK
jgi:hypothetical protein